MIPAQKPKPHSKMSFLSGIGKIVAEVPAN